MGMLCGRQSCTPAIAAFGRVTVASAKAARSPLLPCCGTAGILYGDDEFLKRLHLTSSGASPFISSNLTHPAMSSPPAQHELFWDLHACYS